MTNRDETTGSSGNVTNGTPGGGTADSLLQQVTLSSTGDLADALPYLLGYRPEDSMVLVALHDSGDHGRFGGRARLGIPADSSEWQAAARQLALGLVTGSARRGSAVTGMVAYVCEEPASGGTGRAVMERLRPLAQLLRTECGKLDVPVIEALCLSGGRYWSYCCSDETCCPAEGRPAGLPGTSVLAAAAAYAGLRVRGSLGEMRVRLRPWEGTAAVAAQETALDETAAALLPRLVEADGRASVAERTMELAARVHRRYAAEPSRPDPLDADLRDDELLTDEEAAALILGLQDRTTRDRAAEWMEGGEAEPALRLWRALSRRCVGSYGEHAAPSLTLAGWVAWSAGDDVEAREALAMALAADPGYLFARLLHRAVEEGLDPESVRGCLRAERARRVAAARPAVDGPPPDGSGPGGTSAGEPLDGMSRAEPPEEASSGAPAEVRATAHADGAGTRDDGSPAAVTVPPPGPVRGARGGPVPGEGGAAPANAGPGATAETVPVGGAAGRPEPCRVPVRGRPRVNRRGPGRADARLSRPRGGGGPAGGPGTQGRARGGRRREGM
ncbi:DUF4192 domain-containing protein [Streptomyces chilikensis]|uniref:DUF4192 domain-containing protein n=1 Tax=Streptomyces chilikensis TaxID=1194079 RepID=A0ABV3EV91_9ACTN